MHSLVRSPAIRFAALNEARLGGGNSDNVRTLASFQQHVSQDPFRAFRPQYEELIHKREALSANS